jgi:hypothetical protein
LEDFGRSKIYNIDHYPSWKENQRQKKEFLDPRITNNTPGRHKQKRQHLQRLSPHGLHWPTVDEGLDTAALTSVSLMLLGRRNATTGVVQGTTWPAFHFFQLKGV